VLRDMLERYKFNLTPVYY